MLTLKETDFKILQKLVKQKLMEEYDSRDEYIKQVVLPTAYAGVNMLLTIQALPPFPRMLTEADAEITALAMLNLFAHPQNH